jgi:HemY protein
VKARWLWLIALCAGILIGPQLATIPGFVLIGYQTTTIEMRLSLVLAVSVVVIMSLLTIGATAGFVTSIDKHVRRFTRSQRRKMARQQTEESFRALAEGRWKDAEEGMLNAARGSEHKLINYLGAAMAAQEQNALERRDNYFRQAQTAEPDADLAVGMMEARLHLRAGHYDMALMVLWQIDSLYPRHAPALKLLQHVLRRLQQYEQLERILPRLRSLNVLPKVRLQKIESEILRARWSQVRGDHDAVRHLWRHADKSLRRDVPTFCAYVRELMHCNAHHEAERLTRKLIEQAWQNDLVTLYGEIPGRDPKLQLETAERWAEKRETTPVMLLCFAKLAMRAQQWLKAQRYLNELNKKQHSAEIYLMLAETYEHLQEPDQVLACIRLAMQTAKK